MRLSAFRLATSLLLILIVATRAPGQQADPLSAVVREALHNNFQLAEQRVSEARADAAVRQAKGLALPSVAIETRRSHLDGIADVGALVNPAYAALNRLTNSTAFPTDIHLTFPQAQESHLRVSQPLFNASIGAAQHAARAQQDAQRFNTVVTARDIAASVQLSYLAYASSTRVVELNRTVLALTDELLRASERRLALGLVTPDVVLRARADRAESAQTLDESEERRTAAARSFAVVIGRPVQSDAPAVLQDTALLFPLDSNAEVYVRAAVGRREELSQAAAGERAASASVRAATAAFLPSVGVALDYGLQGTDYRFSTNKDFVVLSIAAQWNLFNGGQDAARREQALLDVERARLQRADASRQIELQVRIAFDAARTARTAIATASERESAARRSWELVRRRNDQGVASPLDALDARTAWTRAALNLILTRYTYASRWVELERAAALRTDIDP
ncbi:MAG: TolC family protein [bacterium]